MRVEFCNHKEEWDSFLKKNKAGFLQSFDWGEFKKNYQKAWRMKAVEEGGDIIGVCQAFGEKLPFGKYLYIPHGPVSSQKEVREELLKEAGRVLGKNFIFIKAEPLEEISLGKVSLHRIQPQKTIVVDIERNEEEILMSFRKSIRYNIRAAEKKGVKMDTGDKVDMFFNLLQETKQRQGFASYPKDYFEKLLQNTSSKLFVAAHQGEVAAAAIVSFFGEIATFLHSASSYEKRDLNATALLVFQSMKYAKSKGCKKYNLWGIDEKKFPGVTLFKKGFNGEEITYPPAKDIPLKKIKYAGYRAISRVIKR